MHCQEKNWTNQGILLSRVTLANYQRYTTWLFFIWKKMKENLLRQEIIYADKTAFKSIRRKVKKLPQIPG
ncbi:MAG TPA: hypothetical protein GXX38_08900 [Clostridia bacterium]|nr:hypothetical protein [Clostridia bacterium]